MRLITIAICLLLHEAAAKAEIVFAPYYSVKSDKAITADKKTKNNNETKTLREEKGLSAGFRFYRVFSLVASVGQNFQTVEKTAGVVKDEYNEIDFSKDLSDSSTPGYKTKKKETQNVGKVTFQFDPSFWIFIARAKAGVTGKQRLVSYYENDILKSELKPGVKYFPHAGFGLGVRLNYRMFVMLDYTLDFFKFPETKPFEREFSLSYAVSF